jgi:PEP-CTERM motif-containing protein
MKLTKLVVFFAAALASSSGLHASLAFTGATAFNANADGSTNNGGITSTSGCCQNILVEQGTFASGADGVALPITLSLGTNVFFFESSDWTAGFGVTTGGLNLFFNGSALPGISAFTTATFDQAVTPGFQVTGSGLTTTDLADANVNSSGSLSFDDGTNTVTLTGFQWVGGSGANPYDSSLTVQQVTLTMTADQGTATPEPGSFLLIGGGLGIVGLFCRRRSAQ